MTNGKIAKNNERVIVNGDFSILIPNGYKYSLDQSEINDNRVLVFIKTECNEYYKSFFGTSNEFNLASPFNAPQCCTIVPLKNFQGERNLSDDSIRKEIRNMFSSYLSMIGGTCTIIKEASDLLVYYSQFNNDDTNTNFLIVTPSKLYNGQIWLNDISSQKERERIAREWLDSIKNYISTEKKTNSTKNTSTPTKDTSSKTLVEKNETTMMEALEEVKSQHSIAESKFNNAKSEIKRMSSRLGTIETIKATSIMLNEFYSMCQALISTLHKVCKPLLIDGISYSLLNDIYFKIRYLNDDSFIDFKFEEIYDNISWDFSNIIVDSIQLKPKEESLKIEKFWYETKEKYTFIAKHNIDAKDYENHKKYESARKSLKEAKTSKQAKDVIDMFVALKGYLDSEEYIKKCDAILLDIEEKEKKAAQEQAEKDAKEKVIVDRIRKYQYRLKSMICANGGNFVCTTENGIPSKFCETSFDSAVGENDFSKISNNNFIKSIVIIQKGIVGLRMDGTCISTGSINEKKCISYIGDCDSWENIVQIAAGDYHVVGLREDGTCVSSRLKSNDYDYNQGQYEVNAWSNIKYITCGNTFTIGLKNDGSVVIVGRIAPWIKDKKNIELVEAYDESFILVDKDGVNACSGGVNIDNIRDLKNIVDIAICKNEAYALLRDGTVVGKHCNNIKDVVAICSGSDLWMLKKDGSIKSLYSNSEYNGIPDSFRLFNNYDELINRIVKEEKEREEKINKINEYKNKGLCQHCGGTFKAGFITIKCTSCGRKKDY